MCPTATLVKVRVMREFVYGMKNTIEQNTQIYKITARNSLWKKMLALVEKENAPLLFVKAQSKILNAKMLMLLK